MGGSGCFDPEGIALLAEAYEAAMHSMGNPGVYIASEVREEVAKRIIRAAIEGVHDVNALHLAGLALTIPVGGLPDAPVSRYRRGVRDAARLPPVRPWPRSRRWRA